MGGIWDLVTREVAFILQVVSVYILTMEMDTLMLNFVSISLFKMFTIFRLLIMFMKRDINTI